MADTPAHSPPTNSPSCMGPRIPIEIISEEEMSFIEAAMAKASPSINIIPRNLRSINSIALLSKRRLISSYSLSESVGDIEDLAGPEFSQKKRINRSRESFLNRFRKERKLKVTDVTGTEWCERQMEYKLLEGTPKASNAMKAGDAPHAAIEDEEWCEKQMVYRLKDGKPKASKAMKAGIARHAELEDEVSKKVKVHVISSEDVWALKFLNFILCSKQLLFYGLTRELPLVSFEEGVWIVGVIDEIRMSVMDTERYATLVDTKTRQQAKLPAEAQRRNGRLQLMCYKRMWDNLVADKFPVEQFYNSFPLNRYRTLSAQIREYAAESGITAENLNDLVLHFRNACSLLPPAHDQLLLRYEWQEDQSLIGEDKFDYNEDWLAHKLESCLEFWRGEREPVYPPSEELWKCYSCKFFSKCRPNANVESSAREEIA